ncbi:MAG: translation initiation factor IF-6 [Candidatus Micrarchaeota archaeon]|nr:translation initiation factor IF-6 [Candidatus Micrarchaeota archaeon]
MEFPKTSNFGNPHIGLFARASDGLIAVDITSAAKMLTALEAFDVPLVHASFGASGLVGIYLAFNSNGAIIPSFCEKKEIALLRSHGLSIFSLPGRFCAAGNNVAANDFGAVINPEIPRDMARKISDCLGVEAVGRAVAGYFTSGSAILATNKGFLAHNRCSEEELKELQSILHVQGVNGTLNTGVAFPSLGAVANSHHALFGEACTGFEMGRAVQGLDLI